MVEVRTLIRSGAALSCALLVGACATFAEPSPPKATPALASDSSATPWIPPTPSGITCSSPYAVPAYDNFVPVPGIAVRAIDKLHFEISNATSQTYYFAVFYWQTDSNLVCGRGVTAGDLVSGPVEAGATFGVGEGSTAEHPITVSIWADPCGEACARPPIGQYVVPISSVEPMPTNL